LTSLDAAVRRLLARAGAGPDAPKAVRYALFFYLAHLIFQGWIASSEGFLVLALIAAGIALYRRELFVPWHPLYIPLALFVAASFVSSLFAANRVKALDEIGEWYAFLTFPLALAIYAAVPAARGWALKVIVAFGIFEALYGLFEYFVLGMRDLENRITGTSGHVMTYSGLVMLVALLLLVLALDFRRPLWIAGAVLTAGALVVTMTRSAWIGWAAGAAFIVLARRPRWLAFAPVVVLIALLISPLSLFGRFISIFSLEHASNLDRVRMVEAGADIIRDFPLLGVGPAQVKEIYPLYRRPDAPRFFVPHLHNNLVHLWAERGFVAFASYVGLFAMAAFGFVRLRRRPGEARTMSDAGIAMVIALSVAGLFEFNFGDTEIQLLTLDLFALLIALSATDQAAAANRSALPVVEPTYAAG
jgi:O-antigen ligase